MNALSPSTEPTDRSTLRVMITSVWPAARIAKIDALTARVRKRVGLDEARLEHRRDRHEDQQRDDDAELADAEDPLGQPAGARALGGAARSAAAGRSCARLVRPHAATDLSGRGADDALLVGLLAAQLARRGGPRA